MLCQCCKSLNMIFIRFSLDQTNLLSTTRRIWKVGLRLWQTCRLNNMYQQPKIHEGVPMIPVKEGVECRAPGSAKKPPDQHYIINNMPIFIKPPNFHDPNQNSCPVQKRNARNPAAGNEVCPDPVSSVNTSPGQPDQQDLQTNVWSASPDHIIDTKDTQLDLIGNVEYSSFLKDLPGQSSERLANSGDSLPDLPFEDPNAGYTSTIAQALPGDYSLAPPVTSENTAALDLQTNAQPPASVVQASPGESSLYLDPQTVA